MKTSYWLWFASIVLLIIPGFNVLAFFVWAWSFIMWLGGK